MENVRRLGDVLEMHPPPIAVLEPAEAARKPRGCFTDDHLASVGSTAESGGDVQRRPAVAAVVQPNGLAGIDADPDFERKVGVRVGLLAEARLEIDGGPDGLAGGCEHCERLVAANLDQRSSVRLDALAHKVDELAGKPGSRFVPVLRRVAGVAAHVGDKEREHT